MSMLSEQVQLLIAGYVLGDLTADEAAAFEQLLRENPAVAEEVAQMQNALETAYTSAEVAPPAYLRAAILERAVPVRQPRATASTQRPRFSRTRAIGVAAAALIAALGVMNYRLWQALQTAQLQTQSATLTYVLQATEANSSASATVRVDATSLEATLTVNQLPQLQPNEVYVLWTVLKPNAPFTTDAKGAILTEVFQVDDRGNFSQVIPVPEVYRQREFVSKVAVTIENAASPQTHAGSPILITPL